MSQIQVLKFFTGEKGNPIGRLTDGKVALVGVHYQVSVRPGEAWECRIIKVLQKVAIVKPERKIGDGSEGTGSIVELKFKAGKDGRPVAFLPNNGKAAVVGRAWRSVVKPGEAWRCEVLLERERFVVVKPVEKIASSENAPASKRAILTEPVVFSVNNWKIEIPKGVEYLIGKRYGMKFVKFFKTPLYGDLMVFYWNGKFYAYAENGFPSTLLHFNPHPPYPISLLITQ